ncbi:hypothetical protein U1Q18_027472, partial [Sarracenia purpurea var. burkii]
SVLVCGFFWNVLLNGFDWLGVLLLSGFGLLEVLLKHLTSISSETPSVSVVAKPTRQSQIHDHCSSFLVKV